MKFSADVRGLDGLSLSLEKARGGLVSAGFLEDVGRAAAQMIQSRTEKGVDAGGAPFEPYSEQWKRHRLKLGRPDATVELKLSGNMLGAMRVNANLADNEAVISFEGGKESEKAYFHNVSGAGASKVKRRFLGLTEEEAGAIEEMIKTRVSQAVCGE